MERRWARSFVVLVAALALGFGVGFASRGHGSADDAMARAHAANGKKQHWHCGMHPQVISDHPGDCPICHMALTPIASDGFSETKPSERRILYWWDPMLGTGSISDHPGKSAMGMEMVPVYSESGGPVVQIDPAVVQNMGVRTAEVTRGALTKTVRTIGSLSLPESGLHDVSLKVGGWIDRLDADQDGMHVTKGEPLFELYSPELQVAEQELISAVKSQSALGSSGSQVVRQESEHMIESAKRKLRLWDVDEKDIEAIAKADEPPRDITFRSPATGHVEEKMVVQGSNVQAGMKILRVADHTSMWLDLQVYEGDLPFVKKGAKVTATLEGASGKTFSGSITFMYPHFDHMTRTLKVRATLENPDFELKPGMYATAEIVTAPVEDTILCPREAVLDTGSREIVFIAEGSGHFSPRKVRTGLTGDNDQVQIIEGLAVGERVVTSGQFLIDVESRTIEATQKLGTDAKMTPAMLTAPETMPSISDERPKAMDAKAPVDLPKATGAQTTPGMPMPERAAETMSTTQAIPPASPMTLVYCPMAKADWLQIGDTVKNPYMGNQMSDCGAVRKKVPAPANGSPLAALVKAYLDTERGMDADQLDPAAVADLKAAAEKLPADMYAALQHSARMLGSTKDLKSARTAFQPLSTELRIALESASK